MLDEREMQFLYHDGDIFHFMDTATYEQIHIVAEVLGDSALYLLPESIISVEFYETEPVGIELPHDGRSEGQRHGARHQGRDRRARRSSRRRSRPAWS